MQHLVSMVRKESTSPAEPKRYWDPTDYQPGDNSADIRDAIHAQAQAQTVSQRALKYKQHSRSQSAQVRPVQNQYHWLDGEPPQCQNLEHNHYHASYDKCFQRGPSRLPLDLPVVMSPNSPPGTSSGGGGGGNDASYRQLKDYIRDLRAAVDTLDPGRRRPGDVDVVFAKYVDMRDQGVALCKTLLEVSVLRKRAIHGRTVSATSTAISPAVTPTAVNPDKSSSAMGWDRVRGATDGIVGGSGAGATLTRRATAATDATADKPKEKEAKIEALLEPKPTIPLVWLDAVKAWKSCVERLAAAHKTSLGNTYKRYEHFATPEILDALFSDRRSRQQVVSSWLKNFGAYKRIQGQSEVASKWETQFQSYDRLVDDLTELAEILAAEESGTAIPAHAQDITITSRGDAILEFSNAVSEWKPILRFRVSSSMLAETSPIFASMFSGSTQDLDHLDGTDDDLSPELPPAPTPFTYSDGTRVLVYKMPQLESNTEGALTLLLHAAHMRNDHIPREISFSRFVAVAEAAMRYRCTSPLELFVEHRWLPQWMHMAQEGMPDGLVIISYAFGLRGLFTRVTKSVIMNVVDEEGLYAQKWPRTVKEKIWNVRRAKMAQVYACCAAAVEEYLRPVAAVTGENDETRMTLRDDGSISPTSTAVRSPTRSSSVSSPSAMFAPPLMSALPTFNSTPRCPKGSHWCDATNLGWLMLVYNQLQLLSPVLQAPFIANSNPGPPPRSLAQIVTALTSIASPPHPVHPGRGVCDPIPAFRSAINDIYNSVCGLTLYDIDGKHHGWALSRGRRFEPQMVLQAGPRMDWGSTDKEAFTPSESDETFAAEEPRGPIGEAFNDEVICSKIMENLESFEDLHSVSLVNWKLHETYKEHELSLMRNVVKADRRKTMMLLLGGTLAAGEGAKPPQPSPSLHGIPTHIGKKAMEEALEKQQREREGEDGEEDKNRDADVNSSPSSDDEDTAVQSEEEQGMETPTEGTVTERHGSFTTIEQDREEVTPATANQVEPPPISPASPAPTYVTIDPPEPTPYFKMTLEEAQRILWPDASPPLSSRDPDMPVAGASGRVLRASAALEQLELEVKFRVEGARKVEGKTLVMATDKQLRDDFDMRLGLTP